MKKYVILFFFFYSIHLFGQNRKPVLFVECKSVILELKKNPNKKQIVEEYDWINILLLDPTEINTIKKINPYLVEEYKEFALGLKQNNKFISYPTKETDVKRIFNDDSNQNQLLKFLRPEEKKTIYFPVYIKDNKAVFEIYSYSWYATYFAELEEGKLSLVKLCETTEYIINK